MNEKDFKYIENRLNEVRQEKIKITYYKNDNKNYHLVGLKINNRKTIKIQINKRCCSYGYLIHKFNELINEEILKHELSKTSSL